MAATALALSGPARFGSSASALRVALVLGCVTSAALAAWVGEPAQYLAQDFELARLLRGMALIKACLVVAAVSLLFWRLGRPTPAPVAGAYLIGTWLVAGASVLIWQLTFIPLAAFAFHAGEFVLLVVAWRDGKAVLPQRGAA
jgi:hypothetical protein